MGESGMQDAELGEMEMEVDEECASPIRWCRDYMYPNPKTSSLIPEPTALSPSCLLSGSHVSHQ